MTQTNPFGKSPRLQELKNPNQDPAVQALSREKDLRKVNVVRQELLDAGHLFYPPRHPFPYHKLPKTITNITASTKPKKRIAARAILVVPTPGTWVVMNWTTGNPPLYEHYSWLGAQMEAERLASENPGMVFSAMCVVTANYQQDGVLKSIDKKIAMPKGLPYNKEQSNGDSPDSVEQVVSSPTQLDDEVAATLTANGEPDASNA